MFEVSQRLDEGAEPEVHLLRIGLLRGDNLVSAALDCSNVQEVIDSPRLEPLPMMSPVMRGVVEVRGVPVPVVPLGLGAEIPDGAMPRLVICGLRQGIVAFQVAQIHGIVVCGRDELQPLPVSMASLGGLFCCEQVIREQQGYRFVIDANRYLDMLIEQLPESRMSRAG